MERLAMLFRDGHRLTHLLDEAQGFRITEHETVWRFGRHTDTDPSFTTLITGTVADVLLFAHSPRQSATQRRRSCSPLGCRLVPRS